MSDLRSAERIVDNVFDEAPVDSHTEQLALALQSVVPVVQQLLYTVESLTGRFDELARMCEQRVEPLDALDAFARGDSP